MKKIILPFILALLMSCNLQQKAVVEQTKKTLKGEWSLDEISFDRDGIFEVTLYNDASVSCFSGSIWKFVSNNNTGKYMINQDKCTSTGARSFRFTIPTPDTSGTYYFMFKPINEKKQSTNNNAGYRMALQQLEDTKMTWTMTTSLEGKPFVTTMIFNKLQ